MALFSASLAGHAGSSVTAPARRAAPKPCHWRETPALHAFDAGRAG